MEISELLSIGIVGVVLSLIIELITKKLGSKKLLSKAITIAASLIVAGLYVWARSTAYWGTVVIVLGSASAVYALFIKK